jgi:hypothetical protein
MNNIEEDANEPLVGVAPGEAESYRHNQQFDNPVDLEPGRSDAPQADSEQLSHGENSSIGLRPSDPNVRPASDPPLAGDVDKAATDSATETGQDGDLTDINKKKAYNYS